MSSPSHPGGDGEPATAKREEPVRTLSRTAATAGPLSEVAARAGSETRRSAGSVPRWATAGLLLLMGLIQLPADSAGLRVGSVCAVLAVVCVALALLLAVVATLWVWALVAAVAVAVVLAHALAAVLGAADILRHSAGSALAGSGAAQAACTGPALLILVLAAVGLLRGRRPPAAGEEV
ncbi:hypothetical protein [Streptomyces sp. NBC_01198]|uniref:hypothetical protein n=1 Tax=Streptomyces sp. NBC_01198 TaxID=2903769 RepID=UPI002E131432|nr:hypothetical protein OG702_34510 [Streptomyces sp. NBC_01198]